MQLSNGVKSFPMFRLLATASHNLGVLSKVQPYFAEVRKELNDALVHAYSHYRRVFAQKPLEKHKLGFQVKLYRKSRNEIASMVS